jgi:hypothetical protein
LTQKALVFGGDTLTATDIAVASGAADIGDKSKVASLDAGLVTRATDKLHHMVEEAIDRMKTSASDVPVVLVGGGSVLINRDLKGVSELHVPQYSGVANAIGAAIAQVGGEVDRVFSYDADGRENSIDKAKSEARARAIEAGANADSVEIIEVDEIPLAYMPGGSVRLRVKAVGDLAV